LDRAETVLFGGRPNLLSDEQVSYPQIEKVHAATKIHSEAAIPFAGQARQNRRGETTLPSPLSTDRTFGEVVRERRSALDFRGGDESMCISIRANILAVTEEPLFADFAALRFVQLYLYVHRVEG